MQLEFKLAVVLLRLFHYSTGTVPSLLFFGPGPVAKSLVGFNLGPVNPVATYAEGKALPRRLCAGAGRLTFDWINHSTSSVVGCTVGLGSGISLTLWSMGP